MLWIGASQRYAFGQPIMPRSLHDFGAPGCFLLAPPDFQIFLPIGSSGQAALAMPIPNDPILARLTLFAQGTVVAPSANALGWLFTGGLTAKIP